MTIIRQEDDLDAQENGYIFFTSKHCAACRILEPLLERSGLSFTKIDAEKRPALATAYQIKALPTVLFLQKGKIDKSYIGISKELRNLLRYTTSVIKEPKNDIYTKGNQEK